MRAGRLHKKILIESVSEVRDSRGETTQTWSTTITTRAAIAPLRGREYFEAHQENREVTHKIIIRYQSGITPKMRINFNGRYFDIESIINVEERNRELNLMCVERLPE